jgi:hypothetical protein
VRKANAENVAMLTRRIAELERDNDNAKSHNDRIVGKLESVANVLLDCLPRRDTPQHYAPKPENQRAMARSLQTLGEPDEQKVPEEVPEFLVTRRDDSR